MKFELEIDEAVLKRQLQEIVKTAIAGYYADSYGQLTPEGKRVRVLVAEEVNAQGKALAEHIREMVASTLPAAMERAVSKAVDSQARGKVKAMAQLGLMEPKP